MGCASSSLNEHSTITYGGIQWYGACIASRPFGPASGARDEREREADISSEKRRVDTERLHGVHALLHSAALEDARHRDDGDDENGLGEEEGDGERGGPVP